NRPNPGTVIISTSATEVSIHAVSPEFGVHFSRILPPQAGGPASSASAVPPNASQRSAMPKRTNADVRSLRGAYLPVCIFYLQVPVSSCCEFRIDFVADLSSDECAVVERQNRARNGAAACCGRLTSGTNFR